MYNSMFSGWLVVLAKSGKFQWPAMTYGVYDVRHTHTDSQLAPHTTGNNNIHTSSCSTHMNACMCV